MSLITRRIVIENPDIPGQGRIDIGHIPEGMSLQKALEMVHSLVTEKLSTSFVCLEQMLPSDSGYPPNTWALLEERGFPCKPPPGAEITTFTIPNESIPPDVMQFLEKLGEK